MVSKKDGSRTQLACQFCTPRRRGGARQEAAVTPNLAAILCVGFVVLAAGSVPRAEETGTMKISISIDGKKIAAALIDSPTSRDFVSMLPLSVSLDDYGDPEKIAYLPRKLSTESAPAGSDPRTGHV